MLLADKKRAHHSMRSSFDFLGMQTECLKDTPCSQWVSDKMLFFKNAFSTQKSMEKKII